MVDAASQDELAVVTFKMLNPPSGIPGNTSRQGHQGGDNEPLAWCSGWHLDSARSGGPTWTGGKDLDRARRSHGYLTYLG